MEYWFQMKTDCESSSCLLATQSFDTKYYIRVMTFWCFIKLDARVADSNWRHYKTFIAMLQTSRCYQLSAFSWQPFSSRLLYVKSVYFPAVVHGFHWCSKVVSCQLYHLFLQFACSFWYEIPVFDIVEGSGWMLQWSRFQLLVCRNTWTWQWSKLPMHIIRNLCWLSLIRLPLAGFLLTALTITARYTKSRCFTTENQRLIVSTGKWYNYKVFIIIIIIINCL